MQPSRQESSKRVVPEVLFPNFSHKKCAKYSLLVFLDSSNFVGKFCVSWVLSTSVWDACICVSIGIHTATHSTSGNAHETQSFPTKLRKTKKVPTNTWHKHLFPKICLTPSNMLYSHLWHLLDYKTAKPPVNTRFVTVLLLYWYVLFFCFCAFFRFCFFYDVPHGWFWNKFIIRSEAENIMQSIC